MDLRTRAQLLVSSSAIALFLCSLAAVPARATPVVVDGKAWQQVADFTNLSWNDVAGVCSPTTGACSGTLNGHDVTGLTWASVDEVGSLFKAAPFSIFPGGIAEEEQVNSLWAPAFFDVLGFVPTFENSDSRNIFGVSRTTGAQNDPQLVFQPTLQDFFGPDAVDRVETANTGIPQGDSGPPIGVWLYTRAPAPPTDLLFGGGLVGFAWSRRGKRA